MNFNTRLSCVVKYKRKYPVRMAPPSKAALDRLVEVISNLEIKITKLDIKLDHCCDTIKTQNAYIQKQDNRLSQLLEKIDELSIKNDIPNNKHKNKRKIKYNSHVSNTVQQQHTTTFSNTISSIPPRMSVPLTLDDSGPHGITMIEQPLQKNDDKYSTDNYKQITMTSRTSTPDPRETQQSTNTTKPLGKRTLELKSGGLRAAPPRIGSLHLFNFNIDTTPEDIKQHLLSKLKINNIGCERLPTRGEYASFKLDVPTCKVQSVRDPGLWPTGVSIRKFNIVTPKNSKNTHTRNDRG